MTAGIPMLTDSVAKPDDFPNKLRFGEARQIKI
jgi:hypothetical protein